MSNPIRVERKPRTNAEIISELKENYEGGGYWTHEYENFDEAVRGMLEDAKNRIKGEETLDSEYVNRYKRESEAYEEYLTQKGVPIRPPIRKKREGPEHLKEQEEEEEEKAELAGEQVESRSKMLVGLPSRIQKPTPSALKMTRRQDPVWMHVQDSNERKFWTNGHLLDSGEPLHKIAAVKEHSVDPKFVGEIFTQEAPTQLTELGVRKRNPEDRQSFDIVLPEDAGEVFPLAKIYYDYLKYKYKTKSIWLACGLSVSSFAV